QRVLQFGLPLLELDDPLDAGEVDALLLGEPLHLAQQFHVAGAVTAAAAPGAPGVGDPPAWGAPRPPARRSPARAAERRPPAGGALGLHDPEPVVLTQRLRVHAGH